jgi:aspartyl-tRNA(Asn)/glutamyl-tRNA(Gln) amidotransferase subunit A
MNDTLQQLAHRLAKGETTSSQLLEDCLRRITDSHGEGLRTFRHVDVQAARAQAQHLDALRLKKQIPTPYAGIPICVKDNMDVAGQPTRAGSVVLNSSPPARTDAPLVARLKAAGFIVLGRTQMTEFAYSGVGLNPHQGTPLNPFDRAVGRIPGGSSSGAAVAVSDGMAAAAIGTDTGGSCRIPAALCGVVGFKPSASHICQQGVLPLSSTLDSVGPLANSVECCRTLYQIMSGRARPPQLANEDRPLRLLIPRALATQDVDASVKHDFDAALSRLQAGGVHVEWRDMPALDSVGALLVQGGFSAYEAWHWHRQRPELKAEEYDPRVLARINQGRDITGQTYERLHHLRLKFIKEVRDSLEGFDLLALPTTPIIAPPISDLQTDSAYTSINRLMLRNPGVVNLFDGCSISLPMHRAGQAPAGFMLAAINGDDEALLTHASQVERLLDTRSLT